MMGIRLEGNFHIITGAETAIQNIERCISIAGLEVASIELEPLASADAVLSKEELEGGVCLVDIGGGTTDIAIFENFVIRHTAVIPFGGNIITEDLRDFRILRDQAEVLKVRYGSAVPFEELRNKHVSIQGEGARATGTREVNLLSVAQVISARVKEILAHVAYQIKLSNFEKKLIGGIVLTGGGSQLKHLAQLTEAETGQSARLGLPREHLSSTKIPDVDSPIYATGIGLLIRAFKLRDEEKQQHGEMLVPEPVKEDIKVTANHVPAPAEPVKDFSEEVSVETEPEIETEKIVKKKPISIVSSFKDKFINFVKSDIEDFSDTK